MKIKFLQKLPPPSAKQIRSIEKEVGCVFPVEYLEFLSKYNGGKPETNIFEIPDSSNHSGVNRFIALEDLPKEIALSGLETTPAHIVPIAFAEGGNYVCLKLSSPDKGTVYFWDHEIEMRSQTFTKLASSISEFLNTLKPFNCNEIKLNPEQVINAWIDPEFLKKNR